MVSDDSGCLLLFRDLFIVRLCAAANEIFSIDCLVWVFTATPVLSNAWVQGSGSLNEMVVPTIHRQTRFAALLYIPVTHYDGYHVCKPEPQIRCVER